RQKNLDRRRGPKSKATPGRDRAAAQGGLRCDCQADGEQQSSGPHRSPADAKNTRALAPADCGDIAPPFLGEQGSVQPTYIVGAGGIGCAVGYALRAAGLPAVFVDADAAKVHWGREHGVRVDRLPAIASEFLHFADWHPQSGDLVVLSTKC